MKKNHLIQYLKAVSFSELKEFKNYLTAPIPKPKPDLSRLLNRIESLLLKENARSLNISEFAAVVYPKKGSIYLKNRLSALQEHFFDFLAFKRLREDKLTRQKYILNEFNKRGWNLGFEKEYKKTKKQLESSALDSIAKYKYQSDLEEERISYLSKNPKKKPELIYANYLHSLDLAYLLQKLRYTYSAQNYDKVYQTNHPTEHVSFLATLNEQLIIQNTQATVNEGYYYRYLTLNEEEAESRRGFILLKEFLEKHHAHIDKKEARVLYVGAINYLARQFNAGKIGLRQEAQEVYENMLASGIIEEESGAILFQDYLNIISLMAKAKAFNWVEQFMNNYHDKVVYSSNDLEKAKEIARGIFLFFKGEYEKAINILYLNLSSLADSSLNPRIRTYMCMAHYELKNWVELRENLDLFRKFLRGNSILSQPAKAAHLQFVSSLRALLNLVEKGPSKGKKELTKIAYTDFLQAFLQEIEQQPGTSLNNWLIEKVTMEINK